MDSLQDNFHYKFQVANIYKLKTESSKINKISSKRYVPSSNFNFSQNLIKKLLKSSVQKIPPIFSQI